MAAPLTARDIFLAAVDRPPADRVEYLDLACGGDAALRRRVEALLRANDVPGAFLSEVPPAGTAVDFAATRDPDGTRSDPSAAETVGTVICGRYKLVERIGEGGMGSVWMAEQTEPVKRKVAVKLIKAGLDSKQVLARFEAERQALALMDHPNIAKVLDGGVHDGRPFFVMELVKGVPITQFCDARRLTPQQRLELFVPVCQAIQHAHQKGVIHRDIKPANVLVALYDDKPVPKVIDFGVAKATGPALTEQTLNTGFGGIVGTPQYMSPEQATFNNLDVDTRSDVYSLGVLLYELLAGSPPFKKQELEKRGLLEILRVVREEEPPKPSAKLSTADALHSLSASRGTEPKKLTGLLRNELDWIVMKALEKDRTRRYETANGFAADINRYLGGEPVAAHPPTAAYRLKKFVRKNKEPVVAGSVVLLTLLLGIAGTGLGLVRAEEARLRESKRADGERQAKDAAMAAAAAEKEAKEREAEQRTRAEAAYAKMVDVLDVMVSEVTGDSLTAQKEISPEQKKFLTEVRTFYREFAAAQGEDEKTRVRIAKAATGLGFIEHRLGRKGDALAAFGQARDGYEKLAADFPAVPTYRQFLGASHNAVGILLGHLGKPTEAEEQHRKSLAIREKLAADYPLVLGYRQHLALSHTNLAREISGSGKWEEAVEHCRKGLAIREKLATDSPSVPAFRLDSADSHHLLATLLGQLGKPTEAEAQCRKGLAIREKLAAEFPSNPTYRLALTESHSYLGGLLSLSGKGVEAVGQCREGLVIREKLAAEFPSNPTYREKLGLSHTDLGLLLSNLGKGEAEDQFRKGLAILEKLATDFPAVRTYRTELGGTYFLFGDFVRDYRRKPADSLEWYEKAITTLRPIHEADPQGSVHQLALGQAHWGRAISHHQLQKFDEAVKDWDRAIELCSPTYQPELRASRATSKLGAGRVAEAVAEVSELRKLPGWNAAQLYDFACVYAVASGKIADKKAEYADAAVELLAKAVKAGWEDAAHMKADKDLDPLREREDFKKLVADLEAKLPPKKEVLPPPRRE